MEELYNIRIELMEEYKRNLDKFIRSYYNNALIQSRKSIKIKDNVGLYFQLSQIFDYFYKYRDNENVKYALFKNAFKQVELFLTFENLATYSDVARGNASLWDKVTKKWDPPCISCFKNLTMMYEKYEMYEEAIQICDLAIELGYSDRDGTKSGYNGRKNRLIKKIKEKC